jgi:hypothetical protein
MADTKISALTAVTTPASTDEFAVNQGGTSKKETRAQIHALESGEVLLIDYGAVGAPGLAFKSDADTGIYGSEGRIDIATAGGQRYFFTAGEIGSVSGSFRIMNETTSATNPLFVAFDDTDTGIGFAAADQLSLIAGGFELLRLADTAPNATLTATVDAASTELLKLVGPTRATSADNDEIYISFYHDVDDGVEESARIVAVATDVTTGTEDSAIQFYARNNSGTLSQRGYIDASRIAVGNASGPSIENAAPSGTDPSLVPGRTDDDTGIGSAAADQLSLIAGALEVIRCDGTVGTKGQVLLPQEDLAATPTLAFGDGNSGFYESADNNVVFTANGSAMCHFQAGGVEGDASVSWRLADTNATVTNPTILPYKNDADTGIGANSTAGDNIVLVVGGTQAFTITEASSINTFDFDAGDNAAPQVGALTSIKSVSTTVAAATAATLTASNLIPAGSFVIGLTLRVETTFDNSSSLTTFSVGDGSDADRWGTAIARTAGTTVDLTDATASPGGWFISANDVVLTADAGTFNVAGGSCDIIIHYMDLTAATG